LQGTEWQKLRKKGQVRPVKQGHSSEKMAVLAGIDPYPFAKEAAETGGFIRAQLIHQCKLLSARDILILAFFLSTAKIRGSARGQEKSINLDVLTKV
jgi:hypothetical protein